MVLQLGRMRQLVAFLIKGQGVRRHAETSCFSCHLLPDFDYGSSGGGGGRQVSFAALRQQNVLGQPCFQVTSYFTSSP